MSNNENIDALAGMFRALSNPTRLRLFLRLLECCGPGSPCEDERDVRRCVGALGENLGVAASTVSHHVKELRTAGLLRASRNGRNIECCAAPETLRKLAGFFQDAIRNGGGTRA